MMFSNDTKLPQNSNEQLTEANEILNSLSPIVQNLYKNKAMQAISAGFDLIFEFAFYILGAFFIFFAFIMNTVFPFHVLGLIVNNKAFESAITNKGDMEMFNIAVKGLVVLIGILLITIGLIKNTSRNRNKLLYQAGVELRKIETTFLNKKKILEPSVKQEVIKDELKKVEPIEFNI